MVGGRHRRGRWRWPSCNTRCPTCAREQAHLAATWLNGNLAGKTWSDAQLIALACAVLLPLAMALAARLRLLEMGDELAHALGARPRARAARPR